MPKDTWRSSKLSRAKLARWRAEDERADKRVEAEADRILARAEVLKTNPPKKPVAVKNADVIPAEDFQLVSKPVKQRSRMKCLTAPQLTGIVEAKCHKCKELYRISANSWAGESIGSKPQCVCGGMIYLADQSLDTVMIGQSEIKERFDRNSKP